MLKQSGSLDRGKKEKHVLPPAVVKQLLEETRTLERDSKDQARASLFSNDC